jgi:hypothetical protein
MSRRNNTPKHTLFTVGLETHTKRKFYTEEQAQRAAELGMLENSNINLSAYKCDLCNGWHLTSRKP